MLWLGPALSGLGHSVGFSDLLTQILRRTRSRRRRCGGCCSISGGGRSEGSESGYSHSVRIQVKALSRVWVFGYHKILIFVRKGFLSLCLLSL